MSADLRKLPRQSMRITPAPAPRRRMHAWQIAALIMIIGLIAYVYFFTGTPEDPVERRIQELSYYRDKEYGNMSFMQRIRERGIMTGDKVSEGEIADFLELLRSENAAGIDRPLGRHSAANRIESFCRSIAFRNDPTLKQDENYNAFVDCVWEFSHEAFPGQGDNIFQYFRNANRYQNWLSQSAAKEGTGTGLSPREREEELWDKRFEIFGEEAVEELYHRELLDKRATDLVDTIAMNDDLDIDGKLVELRAKMSGISGDRKELADRRYGMFSDFLKAGEVQEELGALPPQERLQALTDIRKTLGFSPEEIEQMARNDAAQEAEWDKGLKYEKERQAYLRDLEELRQNRHDNASDMAEEKALMDKELNDYRVRLFGADRAREIIDEEQNYKFRYKNMSERKRRYGLEFD